MTMNLGVQDESHRLTFEADGLVGRCIQAGRQQQLGRGYSGGGRKTRGKTLAMGFEYKVRFTVPAGYSTVRLLERLPEATSPNSSWPDYEWKLEADGFYFLDHSKSSTASVALRRLVDEALCHSQSVIIEEL